MIRLSITPAAFDAIAAVLASGNVLYERERTAQGGYVVWLAWPTFRARARRQRFVSDGGAIEGAGASLSSALRLALRRSRPSPRSGF